VTIYSHLPLHGIKVLDLTRVLAGPLATMMLGDLGADVIKVERPDGGDETRGWGPPFDARGESAYFLSVNRNKRSLAADLRVAADRAVVAGLASGADVVIENFRPGSLKRLGLAADEMLARRPALVWCTITGFGAESARPGYDFVVQAERGWMAITGSAGGEPAKVGVALADVIAGKDAVAAVLAALVARFRTGTGGRVFTSLAHSATAALVNVAQNALVTGREAERWGNAHPNLVPYQLFDARDRAIVIAVGSDAQFAACARALGLDDLAADPALAVNAGRLAARERVVAAMAARVTERDAAHWCTALDRAGVPCGVVKGVLESLREVDASALTGVAPQPPGTVRLPPPRLDEHGDEIRRRGWDAFA
jgi:crotonobetainyl-CoA:carnitine CoA-transferase CaiB-like acyl-CoA transferase